MAVLITSFSQSFHGYSLVCSLLFLRGQFSRVSCLIAQLLWHLLAEPGQLAVVSASLLVDRVCFIAGNGRAISDSSLV